MSRTGLRHAQNSPIGVSMAVSTSGSSGHLAGAMLITGFLLTGGFFVSFMSGNSTRFGVAVATGEWHMAATALGLIGLFVIGVVLKLAVSV